MHWECWQLVYELRAALHIGYRTIGNIQQTRRYVPGRAFWGALTARLAPYLSPAPFQEVGEFVRAHVTGGYLFVADDRSSPLYPSLAPGGWAYGGLSEAEFDALYLGSMTSTAIAGAMNSADEGTLHEVEFISPWRQAVPARPTRLTGFIFVRIGVSYPGLAPAAPLTFGPDSVLRTVLGDLCFGGERRYGFGRVTLCCDPLPVPDAGDLWGAWSVGLQADRPLLRPLQPDTPLLAHCESAGVTARGLVEPVIGREGRHPEAGGSRKGAGQQVTAPRVCWSPGSLLEPNTTCLQLGDYGFWRAPDAT